MKKRNEALDILRIFSLLCINGIHFFFNSGFYGVKVQGADMFVMCIVRSFVLICVPMFIILTGYLMNGKTISAGYFKGIWKNLGLYAVCSVIYLLFTVFYLGQETDFPTFLKNLLSFEGTRYAWYMEMYAGLFLLIPFLNLIFNGLKSRKQALWLIIVLFVLTGLPGIINIYRFDSLEWWFAPGQGKDYFQIVPEWWDWIYPLFYYFVGAYLSKYKCSLTLGSQIMLLISVTFFSGAFDYYRSNGFSYVWGDWNSNSSPFVMAISFLTFSILLSIRFKKENHLRSSILETLSDSCLCAYLLSGIFDTAYYQVLKESVKEARDRFAYAPLMIFAVFFSCLSCGIVVNFLYKKALSLLNNGRRKRVG